MRELSKLVMIVMILITQNLSAQLSVTQGIGVGILENIDAGYTIDLGAQYQKGLFYGEIYINYMGGSNGENPIGDTDAWTVTVDEGYFVSTSNSPYIGKNADAWSCGISLGINKTFQRFRPYAAIGTHYGKYRLDYLKKYNSGTDKEFLEFGQNINQEFALSGSLGVDFSVNPKWALGIKTRILEHLGFNYGVMLNCTYYL